MNTQSNSTAIDTASVAQIFTEARSHASWTDREVSNDLLNQLYDMAKWGPTSMNCLPMRLVFVKSEEAKKKLLSASAEGNVEKITAAPVTVIVAMDERFFEAMPRLFPHMSGADAMFENDHALSESTAFRNGTLQGAYLIIAARALGLDTGPMSGFDNEKLDKLFLEGTNFKSNFLLNLGYADHSKVYPRGPRFDFNEVCRVE